MTKIFSVMSGKGGVGKTTLSALAGCILSERGKTLLLDFDISGPSLCGIFPVKEKVKKALKGLEAVKIGQNLSLLSMGLLMRETDSVIWRGPKKLSLLNLFLESIDDYDFVVIDLPPGLSDEHAVLTDKNVTAIIVTSPQNIALSDTVTTIEFCTENKIEIGGIIENFSGFKCEKCECQTNVFAAKGGLLLAEEYGLRFVTALAITPFIATISDNGTFFQDYNEIENCKVFREFLWELIASGSN